MRSVSLGGYPPASSWAAEGAWHHWAMARQAWAGGALRRQGRAHAAVCSWAAGLSFPTPPMRPVCNFQTPQDLMQMLSGASLQL